MNKNEIAVWVGAATGVILLVLYLANDAQDSGGSVNPVYQISGVTPEVAAIYSGERVANIMAKKDVFLGYFAQQLGIAQSGDALTLGTVQSNNSVTISAQESAAVQSVAATSANAQIQAAQLNANAQIQVAKQQSKGKNISAVGGVIGNIAKVLSFF